MKAVKRIFDFYLSSSIHVALNVVALCLVSIFEHQLSFNYYFLVFIFFGSITAYNFVKYAGIAGLHHRSLAKNLQLIQVFSFVCFLALLYTVFFQEVKVLIACGGLGLLTLFYAIPFFKEGKNLRAVPGLKILIIALVWAGVTVLLPFLQQSSIPVVDFSVEFLQKLLFILFITIPFEIRDFPYDAPGLATIPQQIGVKRAKILGYLGLVMVLVLEIFHSEIELQNMISLVLVLGLSGFLLYKTKIKQGAYFSSFWVEAIPMFWLVVNCLVRYRY